MANTTVTAGTYTTTNITVDAQGRITAASSGSGGGLTLTDDTSTSASYYPIIATATSGSQSAAKVSSTKLYFNPSTGTLYSTTFNSLSDINFKENIKTIQDATTTINKLDGVEFDWKEDGKHSYGVIAQKLEEILPELVETNEQGIKTVNYSGITGFLINAIKEMDARIKELESK